MTAVARWRVKPGCCVVKGDGVVVHAGQTLRDSELPAGSMAQVCQLLELAPDDPPRVARKDRSLHDPDSPRGRPDYPTR